MLVSLKDGYKAHAKAVPLTGAGLVRNPVGHENAGSSTSGSGNAGNATSAKEGASGSAGGGSEHSAASRAASDSRTPASAKHQSVGTPNKSAPATGASASSANNHSQSSAVRCFSAFPRLRYSIF